MNCENAGWDASLQGDAAPVARVPLPPERLKSRGKRTWAELATAGMPATAREVLVELCRTVDRLEDLDRLLSGGAEVWLRFVPDNMIGTVINVVVDDALREARLQAAALKALTAEFRRMVPTTKPEDAKDKPATTGSDKPEETGGAGNVVSLAARIAGRRATTTG